MESDNICKLKDLQSENQALKQIVDALLRARVKLLRKNGQRRPDFHWRIQVLSMSVLGYHKARS